MLKNDTLWTVTWGCDTLKNRHDIWRYDLKKDETDIAQQRKTIFLIMFMKAKVLKHQKTYI